MRSLSLILFPSLLLAATGVSAQTQQHPQTEPAPAPAPQVQVTAEAPPFQFRDYEAEAISGGYKMSNGSRLKVEPSSDGIVAQMGKQRPIRLVALSRDLYATRDGNVSMEFNRGPLGEDMVMSYVPDLRTAQRVVLTSTSTLAQR
jgi:hypothetical protein